MKIRKPITAIALAAALTTPLAPITAEAGWGKFWKQVTSKDCWKRFSTTDEGFKQNCKL